MCWKSGVKENPFIFISLIGNPTNYLFHFLFPIHAPFCAGILGLYMDFNSVLFKFWANLVKKLLISGNHSLLRQTSFEGKFFKLF
jgi:hypothetical protein